MIVDGGLPSVPVGPADRSARPSALVGTAGEVATRPMATGGRISPASSQENQVQADHPAGAAIPPLLSSTGGGGSARSIAAAAPRLPRGYSERFCVPCNRRGAAHINGRCVMEHTHG